MPSKDGRTPAAFIPSLPRLAWTVNSASFPAEAEWTQASFPAVRNPVSSKWTTSAAIRCRVIAASAGARNPAVLRAAAASAPGEGARPNMSERAWQARSLDRNWPCHR
jgi:hypothetical protein